MKKVLFMISSLNDGGAERVVSEISSGLSECYDVYILKFYNSSKEYIVSENVKVINLSKGDIDEYNQMSRLKRMINIRKNIKQIAPDVIIPFLPFVCVYCFISLIFTRFIQRIFFTERCNSKYGNKITGSIKSIFQLFVRGIIVQNEGQKNQLPKIYRNKVEIIPNPIPKMYFDYNKSFSKIPKHIISIGRLSKQKNYELALKAFEKVLTKFPKIKYHIFGQGEEKDNIIKIAKKLGIEKNVILEGYRINIDDKYKNADIFLMTSDFEGLPNSLAESLAIGIPCISTNCDFGPSELIDKPEMGILVEKNDVDKLSSAISSMIINYNSYVDNSIYRKNRIREKYEIEIILDMWKKIIDK